MMKSISLAVAFAVALLVGAAVNADSGKTPAVGGVFPNLTLPVPQDDGQQKYLGLPAGDTFRLTDIKSRVLVIEIFSMYCPFCQREAPHVNRLHQALDKASSTNKPIKIIGIGAGNSPLEVDLFRETYNIAFPLLPDGDLSIHKMLGEVRTPYFFVIELGGKSPLRVIYSKLGGIDNIDAFVNAIR